jgi:uncharacterized Zn finger protein (UPF0148 family)
LDWTQIITIDKGPLQFCQFLRLSLYHKCYWVKRFVWYMWFIYIDLLIVRIYSYLCNQCLSPLFSKRCVYTCCRLRHLQVILEIKKKPSIHYLVNNLKQKQTNKNKQTNKQTSDWPEQNRINKKNNKINKQTNRQQTNKNKNLGQRSSLR